MGRSKGDAVITLEELAYDVLNTMVGGRSTNNEYISLPQIKHNILVYRSLLLRRDYERGQRLSEFEQRIQVKMNSLGGTIYKSENLLPVPVRLKEKPGISLVMAGLIGRAIPMITRQRSPWQMDNRYTSGYPYCYYDTGSLYVNHPTPLSSVWLTGIFENPQEAADFEQTVPQWNDKTSRFPCSMDIAQQIKTALLNTDFRLLNPSADNDRETDTLPPRAQ